MPFNLFGALFTGCHSHSAISLLLVELYTMYVLVSTLFSLFHNLKIYLIHPEIYSVNALTIFLGYSFFSPLVSPLFVC